MRMLLFTLIAITFCSPIKMYGVDEWREQRVLSAILVSAGTAISEYESWADDLSKAKRSLKDSDHSINLMTESIFLVVQMALAEHPNPRLLEECLIFLGTKVRPEFKDLWAARILEMADLDPAVTKKVSEILKSKNLRILVEETIKKSSAKDVK